MPARSIAPCARTVALVLSALLAVPAHAAPAPEPGTGESASEPAAPEVAADPKQQHAQRLYRAGVDNYDLGRYAEAIEQFEQAWQLHPMPQMLFNLGQAYWKWYSVTPDLSHLRQARAFFHSYDMRMRGTEGYRQQEIDSYLQAIDAQIAAQDQRDAAREATALKQADEAAARARAAREEAERQARVTRVYNISGTSLIVLGSASLAMGFAGIGVRESNRALLKDSSGDPGTTSLLSASQVQRRRDNYLLGGQLAFAGFISGGIVLAAGIALRIVGAVRKRNAQDARASLAAGTLTVRF